MVDALCALARYPNVTVVPVVETAQNVSAVIRVGSAVDHIPKLSSDDSVHVCGSPQLVEAVRGIAAAAGSMCYCVPLRPARRDERVVAPARSRIPAAVWFSNLFQHGLTLRRNGT